MVTLTFLYTPVEKSKSYLEMLFTWKKTGKCIYITCSNFIRNFPKTAIFFMFFRDLLFCSIVPR